MIKQLSGYENISLFFVKKSGHLLFLGGKYHITDKGKNNPFPMAGQGLLNGRLLQSAAMDCTVHCSRLYGPLQ